MNWTKQICAVAVTAALGLGTLGASPAAVAQPAPYTPEPKATVSTTNPPRGGTITVKGSKWKSREQVRIQIHSKKQTLKVVKTNRKGRFSTSVKLPRKYWCAHTIIVKGKRSGKSVRIPIVIGNASRCR